MISVFNNTASCIFSLKVRSSGDIINRIKRKNEKRYPRQFTQTIQTTHQKHRHEANTCILHDKKQQRAEKKHKNKNIFHFSCKMLARVKLLIYLCNVKRKRPHRLTLKTFGEVAEWSIAPVLKTGVLRGTGGSNPSLSARNQETTKVAS